MQALIISKLGLMGPQRYLSTTILQNLSVPPPPKSAEKSDMIILEDCWDFESGEVFHFLFVCLQLSAEQLDEMR